jgi:hypothetical protein
MASQLWQDSSRVVVQPLDSDQVPAKRPFLEACDNSKVDKVAQQGD